MNSYIARGIVFDVRKSVQGFCSCVCFGQRCSRICPSIVTAILIPSVFILQMTGLFVDQWVFDGQYYGFDNSTRLACLDRGYNSGSDNYSNCLCALEISCNTLTCILLLIWLLVGCKTCCQTMDIDTCRVCCVCILPSLNIISGILNLCCCIIAMQFFHENKDRQLSYGFSFFAYAISGILTFVISLVSLCGYVCIKAFNLRNVYYIQAGSDDAETETDRLVRT
ncbi:uncharacterized protein LOC132727439 [Ruditapes philippinarum]|uniref:uncharacterized protein LOC132727439 n=1 Tax=Ruditapes philippinarum TaxID=129788 RepID=UPI00295BCEFC|nr:uncharacterized protein LOC132727439 [Ruditapes philippinarum]XP_060568942.1 uncharacterized protein LOC132727439 [Ruditapes philippinarum]XP_060568943.1 uncharacterized protein LOC132727439 [Ruditapes philippinarum]